MQVNINPQRNSQSFGTIYSNEHVNKIIKNRVNLKQLKELQNIFDKSSENKLVNVTLFANPNNNSISANIYSTVEESRFFKSRSENFFTKNFGGGIVGFIKKCAQIADKAEQKISNDLQIANTIKNDKLF